MPLKTLYQTFGQATWDLANHFSGRWRSHRSLSRHCRTSWSTAKPLPSHESHHVKTCRWQRWCPPQQPTDSTQLPSHGRESWLLPSHLDQANYKSNESLFQTQKQKGQNKVFFSAHVKYLRFIAYKGTFCQNTQQTCSFSYGWCKDLWSVAKPFGWLLPALPWPARYGKRERLPLWRSTPPAAQTQRCHLQKPHPVPFLLKLWHVGFLRPSVRVSHEIVIYFGNLATL